MKLLGSSLSFSRSALWFLPLLATACSGPSSLVPELKTPRPGAILDNGCHTKPDPIVWDFDWSDVSDASAYQLELKGPSAPRPTSLSSGTSAYQKGGIGYVVDRNRQGWTWRVRAEVNGTWGDWSETRTFDVEPLDTDCP